MPTMSELQCTRSRFTRRRRRRKKRGNYLDLKLHHSRKVRAQLELTRSDERGRSAEECEQETWWSEDFVSCALARLFIYFCSELRARHTRWMFFLSRSVFLFHRQIAGSSRQDRKSKRNRRREGRCRRRNTEGIVVARRRHRRPRLIAAQACGTRMEGNRENPSARARKRGEGTKNGEILKILINTPHMWRERERASNDDDDGGGERRDFWNTYTYI